LFLARGWNASNGSNLRGELALLGELALQAHDLSVNRVCQFLTTVIMFALLLRSVDD
jgi:hypothetical protein